MNSAKYFTLKDCEPGGIHRENASSLHLDHPQAGSPQPKNKWLRLLIAASMVVILCVLFACTYNRNAPLINVQDSANGNTVPVSAAP